MKTINGQTFRPEHAQLSDPKFVDTSPFNELFKDDDRFDEQVDLHVKAQTLLLPFLYDECEKVLNSLDKEPGSDITYGEFWRTAERVCTHNPTMNRTGWLCMNSFNTWEAVIKKAYYLAGATDADKLVECYMIGSDVFPTWNMDAILEHVHGIVYTKDDPWM